MAILTADAQAMMNQRLAELNATDSDTIRQDEQVSPENQSTQSEGNDQEHSQHSEQSEDKKTPDSIPYSRFQKEIQKRKNLENEIQTLRSDMENFKRSSSQREAPTKEKSWLDDLLAENGNTAEPDKYSVLESRVAAFEAQQAQATLDNILSSVNKSHPDMPQEMVLAAIANGKGLDEAVQTWTNLKEMVLKNAGHGQVAQKQAPSAAPVLRSSGVGKPAVQRPKTMDEAHAAFNGWLRSQK